MKVYLRVFAAILVLGLLATSVEARPVASGVTRHNQVVPPTATVFGLGYAEWAVQWWQWANGIPYSDNPLLDATGGDCAIDQPRGVWFLGGLWGDDGGSVERSCTIPVGRFLFFPVANALWLTMPGDVGPVPADYKGSIEHWYLERREAWFHENQAWIEESVLFFTDREVDLVAEIDGVPVRNLTRYRIETTAPFYSELPETSLWTGWGATGEGTYGPAIDSGSTYLMLRPLSPGSHTLHLRWRVVIREWGIDLPYEVFYNLHVGRGK